MFGNEKVGVGIVTCNRPDTFKLLFASVNSNIDIDEIVVVKNKSYDYGDIDYKDAQFCNILLDVGVGKCKNIALSKLLDAGCQHIFLIEDDIEILDNSVFRTHIETAQHFYLGHLNWNTVQEIKNNPTYVIQDGPYSLDISIRLCGCFSYFSREVLLQCGLIDAKHYVNALEHVEHLYRIAAQGYTTPFYAFAGIHGCDKMLANVGEGYSTIDHHSELYLSRLKSAYSYFEKIYSRKLNAFKIPEKQEVINFLQRLQR